ncbi:Acyltransferase family protein [Enterococcus malodoratus]|uniref:acyltransferase family protein n=1 Tax=Enterococcus malodoratus TaxID=71451 RepID=UPI0008D015DD|nr:acyltransferase [Enterococcus malodoratus]SET79264.1 Acyltransferase family protein [Enterococcus malodoratus]
MIKKFDNYKMVDIIKYLAAILVICVHCNPIVSEPHLNYFIKQILCRIAVPFFFIGSAYFVRRGMKHKSDYLKQYLKNLGKSYLFWSIVFIPIGMDWINQNLRLAHSMRPFALIFGLIHVGTYYHLWYIPALILSLWGTAKLLKYFSYKILFFVSILFYLFGSFETYYGYLDDNWFKDLFDMIIQIFFTTRSGILFGMVFVVIGFFIYDYQETLKGLLKFIPIFTIIFACMLIIEGESLYHVEKLDMNFLLLLLPFSFFFFLWTLSAPFTLDFDTRKIRDLSKYYYFVHPVCIVIVEEIGLAFNLTFISAGVFSFVLIFLFTHLFCEIIIRIKKYEFNFRCLWMTVVLGFIPTFIFSSFIYFYKTTNSILKFELVPSLFFINSFIIFYLLQLKKNQRE